MSSLQQQLAADISTCCPGGCNYAAWLDYFIALGLMSYCKCLSLIIIVQVQEGLLFVWPSSGPEAFIHSAAVSPAGSQVAEQVTSGKLSC